jgi:serine/threonine protein kinase
MPAPASVAEFLDLVSKSGLVEDQQRLDAFLDKMRAAGALPDEPAPLASRLVRAGLLTAFQAEMLMQGKWRRFTIGKYKVLERVGAGGMGSVWLCEHKLMRRRVAVKILPAAKADDPVTLKRFHREGRSLAVLDHPNIIRVHDLDQEDKYHFLVLEYVDGPSLEEIVKKQGPLPVAWACQVIRQTAVGLQHVHRAGLIHRDIQPGNLLVNRRGIVKIIDMGLARFFHDEEDVLTKKYDERVIGTADYLSPEQALDSHAVDIRSDIYSLGMTLYFCLTGQVPFPQGSVAQKLIWHQTRQPKPIRSFRSDVPEKLLAVFDRMTAKNPEDRYQTPGEVARALAPWVGKRRRLPAPADMGRRAGPGDRRTTAAAQPRQTEEPSPASAAPESAAAGPIPTPFAAYLGDEPFVFVSYAHSDAAQVYPEITRLHQAGCRIWYDEGINAGQEWPDEVAGALERCTYFLVFLSPRAVESANVRDEIHFALTRSKPFLAVYLEETDLPKGLELRTGRIQAMHKFRMAEGRYHRLLERALPVHLFGRIG